MIKKIFAVAFLSLALTACESTTENSNTKPAATPANTPAAAAPAEASPSVTPLVKAGDKVKVTINGTASEATVVSVDEKAGKATVRVQGQKEDKLVALADIVKQ
jgi:sRNA-binding protein